MLNKKVCLMKFFLTGKIFAAAALILTGIFLSAASLLSEEPSNGLNSLEPLKLSLIDESANNKLEIIGTASYYAHRFHQRKTANGEQFDMHEYSAAHKTLPFGTILRVSNLKTNKSTLVRINDRGPYVGGRIIDLSYKSAKAIDGKGLPKVRLEGFIPGTTKLSADKDYFYGYSPLHSPICIPAEFASVEASFDEFDSAVDYLKSIMEENPQTFLFVEANRKNYREKEGSDYNYYIGTFDGKLDFLESGIYAEKIVD
jgi:rare lipoprotein A